MRGSDFSPSGDAGTQAGYGSSPAHREAPELAEQSPDRTPGEEGLAAYLWHTAVIRVITMIAVRLGY